MLGFGNKLSSLGEGMSWGSEQQLSTAQLLKMLSSKSTKQKLLSMKVIVEMLTRGHDMSSCFSEVVKNISCNHFELKRLIYIFLVHYSSTNHELALLSINSFHNDLRSPNERTRTNALKAMSSMRVPVVLPLLLLSLQNASKDSSAYVRKAVAHAVPKLFVADPSKKDDLLELLRRLLADKSLIVFPSAVWALFDCFPQDAYLEFLHAHFRFYCKVLADLEASAQTVVLEALLRYARKFFGNPEHVKHVSELDPDHAKLLSSSSLLLHSASPSVVLAVVKLFVYASPRFMMELHKIPAVLIRLLQTCSNPEMYSLVLSNISTIAFSYPHLFTPFLNNFYSTPSDSKAVRDTKLDILSLLACSPDAEAYIPTILNELYSYTASLDYAWASAALSAIGRIGSSVESSHTAQSCVDLLLPMLNNKDFNGPAVVSLRRILQKHGQLHEQVVPKLVRLLYRSQSLDCQAKASIVWMVGEFHEQIPKLSPDVLRQLSKSFAEEPDEVKMQTLNLACKLWACSSNDCTKIKQREKINTLFEYILRLCEADLNYDLRDKARLFNALYKGLGETSHIRSILMKQLSAPRPAPTSLNLPKKWSTLVLGTLSHAVSQVVGPSYRPLPEFTEYPPPSSIRDVRPKSSFSKRSHEFAPVSADSSFVTASQVPLDEEKFYEHVQESPVKQQLSDWSSEEEIQERKENTEEDVWSSDESLPADIRELDDESALLNDLGFSTLVVKE